MISRCFSLSSAAPCSRPRFRESLLPLVAVCLVCESVKDLWYSAERESRRRGTEAGGGEGGVGRRDARFEAPVPEEEQAGRSSQATSDGLKAPGLSSHMHKHTFGSRALGSDVKECLGVRNDRRSRGDVVVCLGGGVNRYEEKRFTARHNLSFLARWLVGPWSKTLGEASKRSHTLCNMFAILEHFAIEMTL